MRSASRSPLILAPIGHAVLSLVNLIALGLMTGAPLHAQTLPTRLNGGELQPTLNSSPRLAEKQPEGPGNEVPTFVYGDQITGRTSLETTIEGNAELRRGKTSLRADRLEYFQPDDLVKTRGNVRVSNAGNLFWGPELELKIDTFEGAFTQPSYQFLAGGNGKAAQIIFVDDKHFVANQATYTTCERGNEDSWMPDWQMTGERFTFDFDKEIGTATSATLRFKDVPILHWPGSLSFPLSDKRKSGVMPPTFAVDSISGLAVTAPYYFDIAPNRDATLTPTYASKRGVNMAGEFRYLEPAYRGLLRASYLPNDMLRNEDRWSLGYQHNGVFNTGISSIGNIGVGLTLNRVSDDNYWRDFSGFGGTSLTGSGVGGTSFGGTGLTQRLLNNDVVSRIFKHRVSGTKVADATRSRPCRPYPSALRSVAANYRALCSQQCILRGGERSRLVSGRGLHRVLGSESPNQPTERPAGFYAGGSQQTVYLAFRLHHTQVAVACDQLSV